MVKTENIGIYLEHNRDGKLHKIETYKDKDKEDTTLSFWIKLPSGEVVKAGEYVVKEDQSLPHECPEGQVWSDEQGKCVPKPPVENKPPTIEAPALVNARIGSPAVINIDVKDPEGDPTSITWRQVLPTAKDLPEFNNNQVATITYDIEGDYTLQVEARDDHNNASDVLINVKARDQVIPPVSDFKSLVSHTADDDDNSTGATSIKMAGKDAPMVTFGGDGPYNEGNPQGFIDLWAKNVSLEHTAIAVRGNHDTLEDSNQKTKDALDKFFGWAPNAPANQAMKLNNVGLIGLDTDDSKIGDKNGTQYKFVAATLDELSKDPNIDFIVAVMHKPIYSHGYKHGDEKDLRSVYGALFNQYGVAIVWESHNHNFWHTYPLDADGKPLYKELNEGGDSIVYDFNQPHGVIYWGDGSGGHDLYKIGSSVPSFVRQYNDKDFGISHLQIDQNNRKNLRIQNISQAGKVLHSVIIRKGEQSPPQKQPPIIAGGLANDNAIVEPDQSVAFGFNIYDQDGGTVQSVDWQFSPPDAVKTPTFQLDNAGNRVGVQFVAPTTEQDIEARIVATDNDGLSTGKTVLIHVRKAPPADDLTGVEIFDSLKNWTPPDGKDHIIIAEVGSKNHKDGKGQADGWIFPWAQPQGITYMSNAHSAGDDPKSCIVTKDGHLKIRNNQHRTYSEFAHYNFRNVTRYIFPKGAISSFNFSKKGRNWHELGPADNKSKGIAGLGWHAGADYIGGKKEIVHGDNVTLLKDTKTGHTIKAGDEVVLQAIVFDEKQVSEKDKGKIWVRFMLSMDYGDGLKKLADYYDKNPSPAELDVDLYSKIAAIWDRVNGAENQGDDEYLEIIREQTFDLGKEPRVASA